MKIHPMTWSWILRGLGMLCLLPVLFPRQLQGIFPGLEPRHFQISLFVGTLFFVAGAVLYYVVRRKNRIAKSADDIEQE